ncbi:hypothetical protein AMAG_09017 [Allomyces macrogynus ATCC 38327]|uniref:Uncharacterized protein n=1 Tax=Allomyces macrogynus (strain ATCC 38327) TaxID=578462 RepID=A0A0L0SNK2_ALLM3|nr:hypothetical protein AMAG_09017 [Allomyces macrogynus ATCC 38327]|eukprot:KNE63955.1 hypothetical protein AMAG_09017 [Allomyces macrogynus ATCC 38327]
MDAKHASAHHAPPPPPPQQQQQPPHASPLERLAGDLRDLICEHLALDHFRRLTVPQRRATLVHLARSSPALYAPAARALMRVADPVVHLIPLTDHATAYLAVGRRNGFLSATTLHPPDLVGAIGIVTPRSRVVLNRLFDGHYARAVNDWRRAMTQAMAHAMASHDHGNSDDEHDQGPGQGVEGVGVPHGHAEHGWEHAADIDWSELVPHVPPHDAAMRDDLAALILGVAEKQKWYLIWTAPTPGTILPCGPIVHGSALIPVPLATVRRAHFSGGLVASLPPYLTHARITGEGPELLCDQAARATVQLAWHFPPTMASLELTGHTATGLSYCVVAPIAAQLPRGLRSITMTHLAMDAACTRVLALHLPPNLIKLSLAENGVPGIALDPLLRALPRTVRSLNLDGSRFDTPESVDALVAFLVETVRSLEDLHLAGGFARDADALARVIAHLPRSVHEITLDLNYLTADAAGVFAMHVPHALRLLSVARTGLDADAVHALGSLPRSLRRLVVAGNVLSDAAVEELVHRVPQGLRELNVAACALSAEAVRALVDVFGVPRGRGGGPNASAEAPGGRAECAVDVSDTAVVMTDLAVLEEVVAMRNFVVAGAGGGASR